MSLVSLSFGNNSSAIKGPSFKEKTVQGDGPQEAPRVLNPHRIDTSLENKIMIVKPDQFYGQDEVVLIARVLEGAVVPGMKGITTGKEFEVTLVESKIGNIAKKGLLATITVQGVNIFKESFEPNQEIVLTLAK